MALDLLALVLLVAFAWRGARRGALASGLSLVALVAGYVAGWLAATRLGGDVAAMAGVPALLGAPLAGTLAFLAVSGAIGALGWLLRRGRDDAPSIPSRAGGALFGALRGSLVALLVGLLSVWFEAWQQAQPGNEIAAPAIETPLQAATRAAVTAGVEAALGDAPGATLAARTLAHPAESIAGLRALAATPEIAALAADRELWAYVEAGSYDAALAQPSFQRLQWNGERRRELAALGIVGEHSAGDPSLFALEARAALAQVGPRLRTLRNDPDLAALASDPQVAAMVERQDVVGLLLHPGFQRVVSNTLAAPPTPARRRHASLPP
jgi:hypothetical protein